MDRLNVSIDPRTGMHAHQCQLAGRLGVGIAHARCVAFVARGNQLDTGLDQRMRNLEIGGAEQAEAAACAVRGEVPGDDCRDRWRAIHPVFLSGLPREIPKQYESMIT